MEVITNVFISLFSLLTDNSIMGMPLLVWLLLPAVIVLVVNFIKGKK